MTTDLCHSVAQSRSFMPCSSHDNAERDGVQGVRDSVGQSVGGVKREDRERTRLAEKKGDEGAVIASEKTPCRGDTKDRYDNKNDANGIKALANGIRLHMNDIEQVRDGKEGRNVADLDEQDAEDPKFRDDGKNGGQELSEEEQRMGEDAQITSEGRYKLLPGVPSQKVVAHTQPPQQLQQGSVVRWERFLPQRQLRVLLVEDDDSTRHVVSALLRNCSYEGRYLKPNHP